MLVIIIVWLLQKQGDEVINLEIETLKNTSKYANN